MKKLLFLTLAGAGLLISGCQTSDTDRADTRPGRYEAMENRALQPTGVDTSIRNPVRPQEGINRDSDPQSDRRFE